MISTNTWTSTVSSYILSINNSIVQYYMAPKLQVSKDFLKQVLIGEKTLLKKKAVDYIHVSHYEELSVKNLWSEMKNDKDFKIYF